MHLIVTPQYSVLLTRNSFLIIIIIVNIIIITVQFFIYLHAYLVAQMLIIK
jgi:hypothetical protein